MTTTKRPKPIKAKLLMSQREVRTRNINWVQKILQNSLREKHRTLMGDEVED